MFQSAPACERATFCFYTIGEYKGYFCVSIRARVRAGDSRRSSCSNRLLMVFQSAPACERATPSGRASNGSRPCFNPRPRASGRQVRAHGFVCHVFQSAPACERATRQGLADTPVVQPVSIRARVRAGDSALVAGLDRSEACFNPRPRASGRPASCRPNSATKHGFNPRPRASGRRYRSCAARHWSTRVSIRARVRAGDGLHRASPVDRGRCFNPRPRASGRPERRTSCSDAAIRVSIRARVRAGDRLERSIG